jgi:GcrA cell cycle regulator
MGGPGGNRTNPAWEVPGVIDRLSAEWTVGTSPAAIGDMLGFSRGAVIGKAHRLGLGAHNSNQPRAASQHSIPRIPRAPRKTLPSLASESAVAAPLPKPAVVVFQTTAAPIFSIEERDRRILLMAERTHGQCARLLGISPNVVRHIRAKQQWTPPKVAPSPRQAVMASPEPRPPVPAPSPPRAIQATYHYPHEAPSCQWPLGERTSVYHTFRFCGCADVVPGKPYCAEHTEIAYVNGTERRCNESRYNNERSL